MKRLVLLVLIGVFLLAVSLPVAASGNHHYCKYKCDTTTTSTSTTTTSTTLPSTTTTTTDPTTTTTSLETTSTSVLEASTTTVMVATTTLAPSTTSNSLISETSPDPLPQLVNDDPVVEVELEALPLTGAIQDLLLMFASVLLAGGLGVLAFTRREES